MKHETFPTSALDELVANVAAGFENARAMPKSVYTSEDFARLEMEKIFAREWFCAGRASTLAKPGDFLTLDLAGQPAIVIRGRDGVLRAMSNVCLHRMSTLLEGKGNSSVVVCPYHGWSYNLDGCLRGAPAMKKNRVLQGVRLPAAAVPLRGVAGLDHGLAQPATSRPRRRSTREVEDMIADFRMERYVESFSEDFLWNTNWKVLAENFMESYHLPVCHAGTIGGLSRLEEMVCPPGLKTFNYHTILKDPSFKIGVAHPGNTVLQGDRRRTTLLLALYPSLLITLTPGYFWYLSLTPRGPSQVQVAFAGGMSQDSWTSRIRRRTSPR